MQSLSFSVQIFMQSSLMDPEVYLIFRQFIYNRRNVVTDINTFISENTLNRAFTIDDYYYYLATYLFFQSAFLIAFVLWRFYRVVSQLLKFISPKIQFIRP